MKNLDVTLQLCFAVNQRQVLRKCPLAIRTFFLVPSAFRGMICGFAGHAFYAKRALGSGSVVIAFVYQDALVQSRTSGRGGGRTRQARALES